MVIPGPGRRKRLGPARRVLTLLGVAVVLYLGFFALTALLRRYPLVAPDPTPPAAVMGAWHVHSSRSDGRGTPEEIAKAAAEAGLEFVVLADHNVDPSPPRFEHGVLLIDAVEVSTPHGHVVALGVPRALTEEERKGDVLATITSLGGAGFLAHPEQKKNPWRDWPSAPKAAGLELYSADSMFRTAQRSPVTVFAPATASWLTNPIHGLMTVVTDQPALRDRLLMLATAAPFAAICAHDAHGLPSYLSEFRTLAIQIAPPPGQTGLPEDPVEAARHVTDAIAHGHTSCVFRAIAGGAGFELQGAEDPSVGGTLKVKLPARRPEEIQIRVHGAGVLDADGTTVRLDREGAVQVEVWSKVPGMYFQDGWKPWLVSNPLRVRPAVPAAPAPAPAPSVSTEPPP
ncbi:MAG: PHP domain-containing protein [Myxococcaceae bacterium]|nr:PHP domain-containing protein [Myxococcaceae bacterium]